MSARSTLTLKIEGEQNPPSPYVDQVRHTAKNINLTVLPGTLDNQFDKLFVQTGAAPLGVSEIVNLQTALDRFGNAISLSDVALIYIANTGAAGTLAISADSSDGFTNLLGTAANVTLSPGDFFIVGALTAGNLAVAAGNRQIKIDAAGAPTVDYVVHVWGRS